MELVEQSAKVSGSSIEIGVWKGGTGCLIAKKMMESGIGEKIYLCDTFSGVVNAGEHDTFYKGGEHKDTSKETVEDLVAKLGLNNVEILTGTFPEDTGALLVNETFRFCHIDVDVYKSCENIFGWLWPKLSIGGIVVFDDYGFKTCSGVNLFVNEQRLKKDMLVIYNLNGHAIIVKIS